MNGLQQEISNSDDGVHLYDIISPPGECTGIGPEQIKYYLGVNDNPYPGSGIRGNRNPLIVMHMQPNQTYSYSLLKNDFLKKKKNMYLHTVWPWAT